MFRLLTYFTAPEVRPEIETGVFFDIGGVRLGSTNTEICAVLANRDPLSLRQIFAKEYPLAERGRMTESELRRLIQAQLQIPSPAPAEELAEAWKRASLPVQPMFNLARSLKEQGYLIGLLSNPRPPMSR